MKINLGDHNYQDFNQDLKQRRFDKRQIFIFSILLLFLIFAGYKISTSTRVGAFFDNLLGKEEPEPEIIFKEEKTVKMLEGWTNADLDRHLQDIGLDYFEEGEFLKTVGKRKVYDLGKKQKLSPDWSAEFDFLESKDERLSLEGYLFPDTYKVFASTTAESVIRRFLNNFDNKLSQEMREEIKRQGKTIHEIVTMASIIEKEAPIYKQKDNKDAKLISGVFWNRLKIGMLLQSDATLSYIFEDKKAAHAGDELKVDSPYNSYKYAGLPPGPICNPGIVAIEAAIYPEETDYFYFLTPLKGGDVYYGRTHDDHIYNKRKYLK